DALRLQGLEAELAEVELRPALGVAADAALEGLAELGSLGLHHGRELVSLSGRVAPTPATAVAIATIAALAAFAARAMRGLVVGLVHFPILRHRVVLKDFALEYPNLDAASAVSGVRGGDAVIDVGAQGVQRHAAFAVPLKPRDLGAAETAGAVDANALGAQTHRRLHGAFHGAAEGDAAFELLGDGIGHQRRIDLGLAHLDDVDRHFRLRQLGDLLTQLVDVGALLADHHARTRRVNVDPALLVRPLDDDLRDRRLFEAAHQNFADLHVLVQQLAVLGLVGEPAAVPGAVDAEAQADRIDLLSHRCLLRPLAFRPRLPAPRS